MKYIKPYRIFESNWESKWMEVSNHIDMIKDILLDLSDVGYHIHITPTPIKLASGKEPDIYVSIANDGSINDEDYSDIYDLAKNRIVEYMKINGWSGEFRNFQRDLWTFTDIIFERD